MSLKTIAMLALLVAALTANAMFCFKIRSLNHDVATCRASVAAQNITLAEARGVNTQIEKELQDREEDAKTEHRVTEQRIATIKNRAMSDDCDEAIRQGVAMAFEFNWHNTIP